MFPHQFSLFVPLFQSLLSLATTYCNPSWKVKNTLFLKMKFIKRYQHTKKKEIVTCVLGTSFIIPFSFPFPFKPCLISASSKYNVLNNKSCIDVKISHLSHFIYHSKRSIVFQKIKSQVYFSKLLLDKFDWNFKNNQSSQKNILDNSKNALEVGRWCKPNNFLITALATIHY